MKFYYDSTSIKFIVTGSSSLLISEQSKYLTGRMQIHNIYTLEWSEVKKFNPSYTFSEYFQKGGYPEIVMNSTYAKSLAPQTNFQGPELLFPPKM